MDPMTRFDEWFNEAKQSGEPMPEKMVLATVGASSRPSARFLLLKGREGRRFIFYTNYESRKSADLIANPFGALVFYWDKTQKQIRIEGAVTRTTASESDAYWKTRPRESQLGAWASKQSSVILNREEIESKIEEIEKKFSGQEVPRPASWGGFAIETERIEFWTGRPYRIHDREVYQWQQGQWKEFRLSP